MTQVAAGAGGWLGSQVNCGGVFGPGRVPVLTSGSGSYKKIQKSCGSMQTQGQGWALPSSGQS